VAVKNSLVRTGAFWLFGRGFQTHKVEGPESVASHPVVQGIVAADKFFVKVDPRGKSYGPVPVAAAGLHQGLGKDGAPVSGGRVQGEVGATGTAATVELKPQTIQLLGPLDMLAAEGTNGWHEAVTGRIQQKYGLLFGQKERNPKEHRRIPSPDVDPAGQLKMIIAVFF
jgi:hypothetical protein